MVKADSLRGHNTIYWFRKALRLHDNPSLLRALSGTTNLWPVFIIDTASEELIGANRWRFLLQSLTDLDTSLRKHNSRLFVLRGDPVSPEVFPKLFSRWKITRLAYEIDTTEYARRRDPAVDDLAAEHKVEVMKTWGHTLYDLDSVREANFGAVPGNYQNMLKTLDRMGFPQKPLDPPESLMPPGTPDEPIPGISGKVPTLEEVGVKKADCGPLLYPGGETEALRRMSEYLEKKEWVWKFAKPKTAPNSLAPSTTVLSPYLMLGCLSPREFYYRLKDVYDECKMRKKLHTMPPVSLHGQLLWREFFHLQGYFTPNFDKMIGNPVCRQIGWENNVAYLQAWKDGRTGYPFIDAIMTQLRREGWIHHLARHAVACFLTRGDLYVSWVDGKLVFEEWLLDSDWSLNAGNWMWLSASAYFNQYFRIYSPISFGKKTDPSGEYIRKYLPQLADYPTQYIYEPWKAPRSVQERAKCIIGKDYPKPIVDHDQARKQNIARLKASYQEHRAGHGNVGDPSDAENEEEGPHKEREAALERTGMGGRPSGWKPTNKRRGSAEKAPRNGTKITSFLKRQRKH